jgi:hypothetical protein
MPGVFPDYKAPIVRNGAEGRELATARWGMPSSQHALMEATKKRAPKLEAKGKPVDFKELLRMEPDGGTTNIRNVKSKHWTRWLGAENRCVVPFNSFSEFNKAEGGDIWFALDETRPLACFAGIWTNWTSVRKVKEGETNNDLYASERYDASQKLGEEVRSSGGSGLIYNSLRRQTGVNVVAHRPRNITDIVQTHHYEITVLATSRTIDVRKLPK